MTEQFGAILATLPAFVFLGYFHSRDLAAEPPRHVWTSFLLGMLIFVPILVISDPVYALVARFDGSAWQHLAESFLIAALPEESLKYVVLTFYAARVTRFETTMDGIVYGVAVSLGFATIENVLYVAMGGISTAALRALTAVPCHAMLGVLMGYFVGRALAGARRSYFLLALGAIVPVVVHTCYDFPLFELAALSAAEGGLATAGAGVVGPLYALFLTSLVGGLVGAYVLVGRARDELARRRDRDAAGPPVARVERLESSTVGASVCRLAVGAAVASFGGWVLAGLSLTLAGGVRPGPNTATAVVVLFLLAAGIVAYGFRLAFLGIRLPIRQAMGNAVRDPA